MVSAKIESISTVTLREKGIESVVGWFDLHKQAFYTLGWFYLQDHKKVEELFYRTIVKVHRELPRFKRDISFDMWVTSIFIENCRELSQPGDTQSSEGDPDLVAALGQLNQCEKEAILLTYVKGFSQEESAHILRVSEGKMKDLLFSGIVSVRKPLSGSIYFGCKEYQRHYLDYLEKSMNRPEKIEFEKHIYHCPECQEDLASFQDVTLKLMGLAEDSPMWPNFMESVKARLEENGNQRQQKSKKRIRLGIIFTSILAVVFGIAFITGAFHHAYYGWTEEDDQLRAFLQHDLGQRVNIEAESDGVKITITGVVADDIQTLVFYKIEDTEGENQYFMNYEDGLIVKDVNVLMDNETYPRFNPPDLKTKMNKEEKNVFYGKVSLLPLKEEEETIKLEVSKLLKLAPNAANSLGYYDGNFEYKTGEWNFEFPVTKQPSTEYEMNELAEIEGVPIQFNKLIIAPTATILQYGFQMGESEKRADFVELGGLEVDKKKVKADKYIGSIPVSQLEDREYIAFQSHFDPLFAKDAEEVAVQFKSAYFSTDDKKSIALDGNQPFPRTFEYAGSTITIDKIEPATIVISNHEIQNREYESLHLNIIGENEGESISTEISSKSVLVDKNGVEYDLEKEPIDYEKIQQPRHFITEQNITLEGTKNNPKTLEIYGYSSLKYLDNVVKISLE